MLEVKNYEKTKMLEISKIDLVSFVLINYDVWKLNNYEKCSLAQEVLIKKVGYCERKIINIEIFEDF